MKRAALAANLFGAALTLAFVLWKATPWDSDARALPAFFLVAWVVAPYLALVGAAVLSRSNAGAWATLALGLVATLTGAVVYYDALVRQDNPLNLFLFASVPVVQWGIGAVALVAVLVLRRRAHDVH